MEIILLSISFSFGERMGPWLNGPWKSGQPKPMLTLAQGGSGCKLAATAFSGYWATVKSLLVVRECLLYILGNAAILPVGLLNLYPFLRRCRYEKTLVWLPCFGVVNMLEVCSTTVSLRYVCLGWTEYGRLWPKSMHVHLNICGDTSHEELCMQIFK